MSKQICLAVGLVATLAACGKSGDQGNGSQSAAAGNPVAAASDIRIQPGEWEMTTRPPTSAVPLCRPAMPPR